MLCSHNRCQCDSLLTSSWITLRNSDCFILFPCFCLYVFIPRFLSVSQSVCLSICLYVCVSIPLLIPAFPVWIFFLTIIEKELHSTDKKNLRKTIHFLTHFFHTKILHNNVSPNIYLMKTTQSSRRNLSCVIPAGFLTGKGGTGTCGLTNLYLYVAETLESCGSLECKVERRDWVGRQVQVVGNGWD